MDREISRIDLSVSRRLRSVMMNYLDCVGESKNENLTIHGNR